MSSEGAIRGALYASDMHGSYSMLHIELARDQIVHIRVDRGPSHRMGETLAFDIRPQMVRFFHPKTEKALKPENMP